MDRELRMEERCAPAVEAGEPACDTLHCAARGSVEGGAFVRLDDVIVAHPNDSYREALSTHLKARGRRVRGCRTTKSLRRLLLERLSPLVVTELRLPDGPTINIIKWLKQSHPTTRIAVVTSYGSVASAVQCSRLGVEGYYHRRLPLQEVVEGDIGWQSCSGSPLCPMPLDLAAWEYLHRVVCGVGSITLAAEILGLDRRSLRRMLGKYAPGPRHP
jgi:two-component system, response regulator RegA